MLTFARPRTTAPVSDGGETVRVTDTMDEAFWVPFWNHVILAPPLADPLVQDIVPDALATNVPVQPDNDDSSCSWSGFPTP